MADMGNESVHKNNNETESCTLRLMTFNVRNLHGDDGTVNSWDNRKDITVRAIQGFDPDIIGMQEAYNLQIHYFLQAMPHYDSVGISRFGDDRDEYANIFYRKDKFDVLDSGQFWISETPDVPGSYSSHDATLPRMATWAKFVAKDNNGIAFYIFNTHFSLQSAAQVQGARLLLERAGQYVDPAHTPVFLMGDFNAHEQSEAYGILMNSDFQNTWTQLSKPFVDDSTSHQWSAERDMDNEHIDWIFQRNAGKVHSLEIDYYNEDGRYPSDHYPVELIVDIPRS